jgi:peptide/nickel transport system permease protein
MSTSSASMVGSTSFPAAVPGTQIIDQPGRPVRLARAIGRASRRSPIGAVAMVVLLAVVGTILVGPWLPLPPMDAPALTDRLLGPMTRGRDGTLHLLGTDQLGRDVLARTIYGGRISLGIALAAVLISGVVGTALGLVAGYRGGWFDYVVMRVVDFQMAMPSLLLAIFLIYLLGASITNLVLLLSILGWPSYTRVVRSETLGLRQVTYVEGALVVGARQGHILLHHILPQIVPVLSVIAVFDFSSVILAEAGISFLGFGVQPPETSWGRMISEGQQFITTGAWWLFAVPGLAIFFTVLSVRLGSSWVAHALGTRDSTLG